ncbi:AfsR/SARP family transcriptional regulator [Dactylosporangium sp. NPDC005572]|uniref:AfsR/SARP family transcriptional regulator n=1 Tax=Dactylosporangium sp. NPDC005572 TaxID=3156889 RepID=UPI0033A0A11A
MRYEVLGPLRVVHDGLPFSVGGHKVETLLTVLLARAGQLVTHDQLMSEMWGERPPRRATAGLHVYVSQLRKFLQRSGRTDSPVVTRPAGYLLELGPDELDAHRFLELAGRGRAEIRELRHDAASETLSAALGLWRGQVLDDLRPGPILEGYVTSLMETRIECEELLIEARLHLGRHRELISPLYALTACNPLREALYHHLMLALYRSGRAADALQVFQSVRRLLHRELGLEPCRQLQDLQRAILSADRLLDRRAA